MAMQACSLGYAGIVGRNGGVATPYKVSPRRAAIIFLTTSVPTRTCASTVEAPRCGVASTRSCASTCLKYGIIAYGFLTEDIERHSCQSTLIERSQQRLFVYQAASCAVHQVGTRLEQRQFTGTKQPARVPPVSWERVACSVTKSARCSTSSLLCSVTPTCCPCVAETKGSLAITRIPNACARRATSLPMRPRPKIPSTLVVEFHTQQAAFVPPARLDAARRLWECVAPAPAAAPWYVRRRQSHCPWVHVPPAPHAGSRHPGQCCPGPTRRVR